MTTNSTTAGDTFDVQISQSGSSTVGSPAPVIGFCDPDGAAGSGTSGSPQNSTVTGTNGAGQTVQGPATAGSSCQQSTLATPAGPATTICDSEFATTDTTGKVTFGVTSNTVGSMQVVAFIDDASNNNFPDTADTKASATKTWVANTAGAVTCTPTTANNVAANGATLKYTCTVATSDGSASAAPGFPVNYIVESGPDANQAGACGTTNNNGQVTCTVTNNGTPGTDTVRVYVNSDATAGFQSATEKSTTVTAVWTGTPRNIACTPKDATNPPGTTHTIKCTVTDVAGNKVADGTTVYFSATFPGGSFTNSGTHNETAVTTNGVATVSLQCCTRQGDGPGDQSITASVYFFASSGQQNNPDPNAECRQAAGSTNGGATPPAGSGTTAGNCFDTVVKHWVVGATPSSTATGSASPTNGTGGRGTLSTSTPDIQPNIQAVLNATGLTANAQYDLMCYSRPSTTYFVARQATVAANSSTLEFRLLPGTNTRCYIRPTGNDSLASNSVVINVHTTLSLSAVRTGVRTYIFQGRNLPRRSGQLITLYRIANGQEIRTSNLTTDASGIYRVTRTFTGTGTFQFRVRTSQTLTNAPGASNIITVNVH